MIPENSFELYCSRADCDRPHKKIIIHRILILFYLYMCVYVCAKRIIGKEPIVEIRECLLSLLILPITSTSRITTEKKSWGERPVIKYSCKKRKKVLIQEELSLGSDDYNNNNNNKRKPSKKDYSKELLLPRSTSVSCPKKKENTRDPANKRKTTSPFSFTPKFLLVRDWNSSSKFWGNHHNKQKQKKAVKTKNKRTTSVLIQDIGGYRKSPFPKGKSTGHSTRKRERENARTNVNQSRRNRSSKAV